MNCENFMVKDKLTLAEKLKGVTIQAKQDEIKQADKEMQENCLNFLNIFGEFFQHVADSCPEIDESKIMQL